MLVGFVSIGGSRVALLKEGFERRLWPRESRTKTKQEYRQHRITTQKGHGQGKSLERDRAETRNGYNASTVLPKCVSLGNETAT